MRARHIAAIAVLGIIASVATYQAVTAKPPEPYVRLVGLPEAPTIRTICRDGHFWQVYTTSDGVEVDRPTSFDCPD